MDEMQNTKIRLKWLEEQINHSQAELYRIKAMELHCTNLLDGYQSEFEELAHMQFSTV